MRIPDRGPIQGHALLRVAWFTLLVLSLTGAARAETRRTVVVLLPATKNHEAIPNEAMLRFVDNLNWQLSELGLSLVTTTAPSRFDVFHYASIAKHESNRIDAMLSIWVIVDADRAVLYLYDVRDHALRARTLSISRSPLVAAEELAIIARSAITARLEGNTSEMAEVPLPIEPTTAPPTEPRTLPAPVPTTAPPTEHPRPTVAPGPRKITVGLRTSVFVGFPVDGAGLWPGIGPTLILGLDRLRFGLGYGFYPETELRSDNAVLALRRHPIEGSFGYVLHEGALGAIVETYGQLDRMNRVTLSTRAPFETVPPTHRWLTSFGLRGRGELPLSDAFALNVALGIEWLTRPVYFETSFDGQRKIIGQLSPIRPTCDFGLLWHFR
jgi:hypothetical protein